MARVADPAAPPPARTVRLLVLCRQHGDEPASTEAVLRLLRRIADGGDPTLRAGLRRVTLYVVPMVNPDGADAETRATGPGPTSTATGACSPSRRPAPSPTPSPSSGRTSSWTPTTGTAATTTTPTAWKSPGTRTCHWPGPLTRSSRRRRAVAGVRVHGRCHGLRPGRRPAPGAPLVHPAGPSVLPGGDALRRPARRGGLPAPPGVLCRPNPRPRPPVRRRLRAVGRSGRRPPEVRLRRRNCSQPARRVPQLPRLGRGWRPPAAPLALGRLPVRPRPVAFKLTRDGGSATARRPKFVPASGRRSAGRLGMRRYQCSPCSRVSRPAPAACGRRR